MIVIEQKTRKNTRPRMGFDINKPSVEEDVHFSFKIYTNFTTTFSTNIIKNINILDIS